MNICVCVTSNQVKKSYNLEFLSVLTAQYL